MELCHMRSHIKRITPKGWATFAAAAGTLILTYNQLRRNLSLTSNQLYAHDRSHDDGLVKSLLAQKNASLVKILQLQQYTKILKPGDNFGPISWFETNHYNANNPIEDRHCECLLRKTQGYFFGIFDGHSGWHCSESLRQRLPLYLALAVANDATRQAHISNSLATADLVHYLSNPSDDCETFAYPKSFLAKQKQFNCGSKPFAQETMDASKNFSFSDLLKYVYLSMDRDITLEAIPDGNCNEPLKSGVSGAVTVGAYIKGRDLYIANTGDCRAVLGVRSNAGSWLPIALSEDHTTQNRAEVSRIKREHPGEENTVIVQDRLLGQLQPLRAFGDVVYKWSHELHKEVLVKVFGYAPVPMHFYKSPPYLTAQPDIQHKVLDRDDRFLILASDGLWDTVSNEMAVKIVGRYLDDLHDGVKHDENASTLLIRHALSQGSYNRLLQMLTLPSNSKRNFHDDISVTVIYFDKKWLSTRSKL